NMPDPLRVIFSANVTEALNLALRGLLRPGHHVVTSSIEHNAVMRPLRALERQGVSVTVVPCSPTGMLDPADVRAALRPETALIVLNHASNVIGTITPIAEVGAIAHERGIPFLVDTAQTAGVIPLDMAAMHIDLLAFTGHKALLGPMGTGGLVLGQGFDEAHLEPLVRGGTGSNSEWEEQPSFLPDKYESGTPNAVGLAGLEAGIQWVLARGIEAIRAHEQALTTALLDGLAEIPHVIVYGPRDPTLQVATISWNIEGMDPGEVGLRLDEEYGILCRVGLHCSPAAHRTIGTFPTGTVRFGLGAMNTQEEVLKALRAVHTLAKEA
ncbi:MAG: aminotransferase class V-fold PLP-dependent enzyme, partial [Chloroflexi bacterium]|nr:aminotransferase class V-fold PLP-dependent enzyme [Chloroflexota bacterium]